MNTITMVTYGAPHTPRKLHPISLFAQVTSQHASGCLTIVSGVTSWRVYLDQGQLAYATNSIAPLERLERHLERMSQQVPALVSAVRSQACHLFESPMLHQAMVPADWLAVQWLAEQQYLTVEQASQLIQEIAKESFESLLKVTEGTHEMIDKPLIQGFPSLCKLELRPIVEQCQMQLRRQSVQRSSTFLNAEPTPEVTYAEAALPTAVDRQLDPQEEGSSTTPRIGLTRQYTIACVDDSPTVLRAINSFLNDDNLSVVMINDPLKALIQIVRSKPDLILLDVGMPNLDGYELCSMLRKHSSFKNTPIVMVTGHTGFIDRAKAKLVGASGYLTKPFTRAELTKMVFKYLT
jgi:two-component system, chemotaxis family, response regulator PixG